MERLANMLLNHLEGILNYCKTKISMGVVEAVNGNIKALVRRGRGYRHLNYLLLKAQRLAATKKNSWLFGEPPRMHTLTDSCAEPKIPTPVSHNSRDFPFLSSARKALGYAIDLSVQTLNTV